MYKSFFILVFLMLFISSSHQVGAQSTSNQSPSRTNTDNPQTRISSVPMVAPAPNERNAKAKELLREGIILTEARRFSEAVENLKQVLRLDPEYADAYAALGRAYFKLRRWQDAVVNLRRAADLRTRQRESQGAHNLKVMVQESKGVSAQVAAATSPPIKHEAKANPAAVKPLRPKSDTTRPTQPREQVTSAKSNRAGSEIKPQPKPIANPAEVKAVIPKSDTARLTPQHEEATPAKPAPTNPPTKLEEGTNANAAGVKPLDTKSEATQPLKEEEVTSTLVESIPILETKLQQPANSNNGDVKTDHAESDATRRPEETAANVPSLKNNDGPSSEQIQEPVGVRVAMSVTPVSRTVETKSVSSVSTAASHDEASLVKIYRVGPSDVLDIQISDSPATQSTLFTVSPSGLIAHPMLNEPLPVTGLTVEEIGTKIEKDLKQRALIEDPKVAVGVRDYSSHSILVSGLVKESGTKFLRREAIPLYVVVADAQPLPEAGRVTIVRKLNQVYDVDLAEVADLNLLVLPGDVITLQPNVTRYIYIGGEVKFPGEKTFRRGLTLMQAVIAAGGVSPKATAAEFARDDGSGFLIATRVSLNDIQSGKAADPMLQPGDRITILR